MGKHLYTNKKIAQVVPILQTGDYYFEKALKAYRGQDLLKAKKYLERAKQIDPYDPIILCQLATVLTELGEYQQSNQLLSKVVQELDQQMTDCYYFMANNFAHLGLFQEAQKYAKQYIEVDDSGEFADDADDLLDILSIEIEDEEYEFGQQEDVLILKQEKAKNLLEQDSFEEAVELLSEIIKDYPEFWSAYNNLALAYFYLNRVEKAKETLDEVLEKNPGNLHALCNKLIFHYYCQQHEEANRLVDQLNVVYPITVEHRYKLGATFTLVGQYELGYKWLRHLYKLGFQGDVSFYYWLSHSSYRMGYKSFSELIWKRVLEEMPEKEGEEPWFLYENEIEQRQLSLVQSAKEGCSSDRVQDQLYGLYLATRLNEKERFSLLEHLRLVLENDSLVQQVYSCVWQNKQHAVFEVAEIIETEMGDTERYRDLFLIWFGVYAGMHNNEYQLKNINVNGWAAAITYCWKKKNNQEVTQSYAANLYSVSVSTVAKYVKLVNMLLH